MENYSETTSSSSCPCGCLNYLLCFARKRNDSGDTYHQSSRSILLKDHNQEQHGRNQEIWVFSKKMKNLIERIKFNYFVTKKSKCSKSFQYDLEGYQLNFDREVEEEDGDNNIAFVFSSRFAPPASSFTSNDHMTSGL
ncbi:hypothetical protein LIER_40059 [Lithospermum erythrorhizon]|uniref:Uncharacterized protein n=1 Tax=Lithospermum erythrorhizon TaxID=34254 RepID=A0AAV3QQ58_LITER